MSDEPAIIQIGNNDAEFLRLSVFRRVFPKATDFWDGNWLSCGAEVASGAFRANLTGNLRTDELDRFYQELLKLNERLLGEAAFSTLEHWLRIRIVGHGRGHLETHGQLCDDLAFGNTLDVKLFFDQTYLPAILRQLGNVLRMYPVVGRPDGLM